MPFYLLGECAFMLLTAIIVIAIYAAIALGYIPGLRMNRATIALVGAALLVVTGAISEEQALHALDMGTILLLGAMMIRAPRSCS